MDIQKLKNTYRQLICFMREKRHSYGRIISRTESMCRHMIEHEGEYDSYPDYYEKFIDADGFLAANDSSRHLRHIWRMIWAFEEYDHYPDGKVFRCEAMSYGSMNRLNLTFKKFMKKEVLPVLSEGFVGEDTIKNNMCNMARFLLAMQNKGATTLKKINEERILSYFYSDEGKQMLGIQTCNVINMILGRIDNPECKRIKNLLPALFKKLREHEPMSEETVSQIKEALSKEDNGFSLRDRAILTIAIYTGLRGTDIANLTLDNIDWNRDLITIVQNKTDRTLVLPLRAVVGNVLFDYIKVNLDEITLDRYLFHNEKNGTVMNPRKIGQIMENFFDKTGILENGNQRRIRAFRHHVASTLMKNGEDIRIIRSILGHATQCAIQSYFDIKVEDTRKCGRDISDYPVNNDYFAV